VPASPQPPREAIVSEPVVGCVGRLATVKRFDAVIEAMPAVRLACPAARLAIVGDGPDRDRLEATAVRVGAHAYVDFVGAVDDPAPRMGRFACLVIASEHEGLPNAALEALALGVPVVTVPAGDLPRVVTEGVTGALARDGSPASLADAIIRVVASPSLRESAAREGPRLVRERFSEDSARDRLTELYERLCAGGEKKSGAVTGG